MKNIIPAASILPVMIGVFGFQHINMTIILGLFICCMYFLVTVFYIYEVTVNDHHNTQFFNYLRTKNFLMYNLMIMVIGTLTVYMVSISNSHVNTYLLLVYWVAFIFSRNALYLLTMRIHTIEHERKVEEINVILRNRKFN